jgi:hypothetical protein
MKKSKAMKQNGEKRMQDQEGGHRIPTLGTCRLLAPNKIIFLNY